MTRRHIAAALGGMTIGALALTAVPANAQTASGHESAAKNRPATRIVGFEADPNRVHKGDRLSLHGTLRIRSGHGRDIGRQRINVYFRANGSRDTRRVDTIWTKRDGDFRTQARASRSGTWSVRFNSGRLGDAKASDYVTVVR
jgi:hypothetical protein